MTEQTVAVYGQNAPVASYDTGAFDESDQSIIRYLGLNPSSPQDRAVVAVAKHYGLDPVLKHVVVIPKGGVYITRDGMLHVAHRSGQLDGIEVVQKPTLNAETNEWEAVVSVHRKDMRHPFTFPGRYPVNGGNRQYAQEMALKAAESHALRRAFDIAGLPAIDERRPVAQTPRVSAQDIVSGPTPQQAHYDADDEAEADYADAQGGDGMLEAGHP